VTSRLLKKTFLYTLLAACLGAFALAGWVLVIIHELPDVSFLADPGASLTIQVRDWDGNSAPFTVGPSNPDWTPLEEISPYMREAVLAGEDYSFYGHNGVDWHEVYESLKRNFREHRFSRGASTITQQLAKNLFLTREKTIGRKVKELILTRRLEKALTKDRILELYLNVVELGNMVYGVGEGARHHFGKEPWELSLRESAFLAAMLPGPRIYDPARNLERVMNRSDHLIGVMLKGRKITEDQYMEALVEIPYRYRVPETPPVFEEAGEPAPVPALETEETVMAGEDGPAGEWTDTPAWSSTEEGDGPPPSVPYVEREPEEAFSTREALPGSAVDGSSAPSLTGSADENLDHIAGEGIIEIPIKND